MTKNGSNDRKAKARKIARNEGVRVTEGHARLLAAKNRTLETTPSTEDQLPAADDAHDLRLLRTDASGEDEVLDGAAADHAVWYSDDSSLKAACSCGWVNSCAGPRFPGLPRSSFDREPAEQQHWRWYHLVAWAQHSADADGLPPAAVEFQKPDLTLNNLTIGVIFVLRLLLDHAQDDRQRVAEIYEAAEALVRQARLRSARIASARDDADAQPATDEARLAVLPEDLAVGLRILLEQTDGRLRGIDDRPRGYFERLAVETAAGELRRLVLHEPLPAGALA